MTASQIFNAAGPFVLAAILALVPALVELLRTFGRRVSFLLTSRGGWAILGLSAAAGAVTFALVKWLFGVSNDWLTAALVGLTFPTVLRSPLTFVKGVDTPQDEHKESAVRVLSDLYDQLLRQAREDADSRQADERIDQAQKLAAKHTAAALTRQVRLRISALKDEAVKARRQQELNQALEIADDRDRAVAVARVALDVVPGSTIRDWLRRRTPLEP
jgi:hypothetical protein